MEHWEFEGLADLENLGDKVQDIIETAVNSKNYQKMNQSITQAVNHTIRQYQDAIYGTRGRAHVHPGEKENLFRDRQAVHTGPPVCRHPGRKPFSHRSTVH